ncbi:MAG TPA: C39 family peptidase, partial [Pseudomonadales bacterium]|nr:C39 family peptidase [Pseudomonadales bacterium]
MPTPLPAAALVQNVPYVDQHYGYNNCAPSNLTMALKFWGWTGTREQVSEVVKPFSKDKNVMPYELVDYVNIQTGMRALSRIGGTPELLKRMIAAGYPVIIESGVYLRDLSGVVSWMGHYQVVYGYDDAKQIWQIKDSFEQNGDKYTDTYDALIRSWRDFDYAFLVVYPPAQEASVLQTLGEYADDAAANKIAAEKASSEIGALKGQEQFFAYYNRGTSLYLLSDFAGSAKAYDQAFQLYATLSGDQRPWRMVWYQTGPYFAYFNTGRLQDVINLADKTINAASEPYLEESWYWRARAKAQLGDTQGAAEDLRKSLEYHPGFGPSVALS